VYHHVKGQRRLRVLLSAIFYPLFAIRRKQEQEQEEQELEPFSNF